MGPLEVQSLNISSSLCSPITLVVSEWVTEHFTSAFWCSRSKKLSLFTNTKQTKKPQACTVHKLGCTAGEIRNITTCRCCQSVLVMYLLDSKGFSGNVGSDRSIQAFRLFTFVTRYYLQMEQMPVCSIALF